MRTITRSAALGLAALIGISGFLTVPLTPASALDDWAVPEAPVRMPLQVKVPGITSTLEDFPALVTFDQSRAEDVGLDLSVADPDHLAFAVSGVDAPLPYEVEEWDPDGTSSIWVRVPQVSAAAVDLDMYFGSEEITPVTAPDEVWNNGFEVVAHMNDQSAGAADSSTNGYQAAAVGTPAYGHRAASGTPAILFDHQDDHLLFDGTGNIPSEFITEAITVSGTVYLTAEHFATAENHIFSRYLSLDQGIRPWGLFVHRGVSNVRATINGAWTSHSSPSVSKFGPGWYDVTFTYDGAHLSMYYNGERLLHQPYTGPLQQSSVAPLRLGAAAGLQYDPDTRAGLAFDEFRISEVARSADWVSAEHQNRLGNVVALHPVEARGNVSLSVTSPAAASTVGGTFSVVGTTNMPAEVLTKLDGGAAVSHGVHEGAFTVELTEVPGGSHTLEVIAEVFGQSSANRSVTFTVDADAPKIQVHSPLTDASYGSDGFLIDVDSSDGTLTLELDGAPVRNDRRMLPALSGEHVLRATAVDEFGNTATEEVVFQAEGASDAREPWRVAEAAERMPFIVRAEGIKETLTGFPALVQFGPDDLDYATLDQEHLVFVAGGSDQPLPYEIEAWNPAGVSSVWVRVPQVTSEVSHIYMYFNGAPANQTDPLQVWDDQFLAVSHMQTNGEAVPDSTGKGNVLSVVRGTPEFGVVSGSQTPGIRLRGEALEYASGVTNGVQQVTMSTSIYLDAAHVSATSLENYIAAREISGFPQGDQLTWLLHQGTIGPRLNIGGKWSFTDRNPVRAGWNTLSWTYDGTRVVQMINGQKTTDWVQAGTLLANSHLALRLGEMPSGAWPAKPGYIYDEFRVSQTARSVDWLRAEHLASVGQLVTSGARELSTESSELQLHVATPGESQVVAIAPTLSGSVSKTAVIEYAIDGGARQTLGARLGGFSAQLPELAGGSHTLQVYATANGEELSKVVSFTVDATRPQVTFVSPLDGDNYGEDGVSINVEATDDSELQSLRLVLDGKPVENGTQLQPADLVGDEHLLEAIATDTAGNETRSSVRFIAAGTAMPDEWLVPTAKKRIPFVIEAPVATEVRNFPVLIQFDNRMLDYTTIDREHLVFTAGNDTTPLPYDVERWYSSAQLSSIWVRVPSIAPEQLQTITMYFDGAPVNTLDPATVWDEHHEFVAHFGLNEPPIPDASGHGLSVEQYSQQGYWAGAGNSTPAVQIDSAPALFIGGNELSPAANDLKYMVSMTAQFSSVLLAPNSGRHVLWSRGTPNGTTADDQMAVYIEDGQLYAAQRFANGWRTLAAAVTEGWHTIHVTYDGSPMKIYVDGKEAARLQVGDSAYTASVAPMTIGSLADGESPALSLVVDEFRVSSDSRNVDWAMLEYLSASKQLVREGGMQTSDSAPVLYLGLPAPDAVYGPGTLSISGSTWEPLEVTYQIDGGAMQSFGVVTGDFGTTVSGLADGVHEITLKGTRASGRETVRTASFIVDRAGPDVTFTSPQEGAELTESFVIDVQAADQNGVKSVDLSIDGQPVQNGQTISLEELVGLNHTLTAIATDQAGNVSTSSVNFTAPGAYPAVPVDPTPADGATGVDALNAELSVLVDDAAGGDIDVTFHWTYVGGSGAMFEGSTVDGIPTVGGGEPLDGASAQAADGEAVTSTVDQAYPFQRFEIDVPETLQAEEFEITWSGNVPQGHRAELSIWNYVTEQWDEVAEGDGGHDLELVASASASEAVRDGKAQVVIQDVPTAILDTDMQTRFFWLTDTQMYAQNRSPIYSQMTQWVLDNQEKDDIVYGVHTGDIVNIPTQDYQWDIADQAHEIWDEAGFPYGVLPGNHDVTSWDTAGNAQYRKYFGAERFEDNPWYGGTPNDNVEHYDVVSTPGADYLFVYLGMSITPATVAWANEVIKAHPDHNVVIAVHIYLLPYDGHDYEYQGRMVYQDIVAPNPNVGMVLSGHNCAPVTRVQHPTPERTVYEVMMDPQCNPFGGDGYARYIDMDVNTSQMTHSTFSTRHDGTSYWPEGQPQSAGSLDLVANENRTDPYDLIHQQRSVSTDALTVTALAAEPIRSEPVTVAAGERATLQLEDLVVGEKYYWYATAQNDRGYSTNSPVFSFTTGDGEAGGGDTGGGDSGGGEPGGGEPGDGDAGGGDPDTGDPGNGDSGGDPGVGGSDDAAQEVVATAPIPENQLTNDARGGVTLSKSRMAPGERVTISAGGDYALQGVRVWLHSTPTLLTTAKLDGSGSMSLVLPTNAPPGEHRLVLQAEDGSLIGWAPLTVTSAEGSLSQTGGSQMFALCGVAGVLALMGFFALRLGMARRRE